MKNTLVIYYSFSGNSRVSKEHDDESLRNVKLVSTEVENQDEYDTV